MSKIQKALQELRKNKSRQMPAPDGQGIVGTRRQSFASNGGESGSSHGEVPQQDTPELLPEFSISVSLERLREQGLQPRDDDVELVAQQFRRIKRPVLSIAFGPGAAETENSNVIMVASALPKTGKTFCAFNLTKSIAREKDYGAVLVDADVLKPNVSRALALEDRLGLIDYLLDSSVSVDDILVSTDLFGIVVVPAGQQHPDATELLASRRMKTLVETLSQRFRARAIVVDTPPLLVTNEAQVLAENMGQIVLVIESEISTQESVTQALSSLNRDKPINAILNKIRGVSFAGYGGSTAYGGYGDYGN